MEALSLSLQIGDCVSLRANLGFDDRMPLARRFQRRFGKGSQKAIMKLRRSIASAGRWLAVAGLTAFVIYAQDSRGRILGFVGDASGAAIPGASITAIHLEMNTRTPTKSNDAGNYELPYLLPGVYRIEVEAKGFKRYTREPIEVRVGDVITLNIPMEVGAVTESINVTAEAPLLETSSANMGTVFDRKQLEDLPIAGGNVMYLNRLSPGAVATTVPNHNWLPSATDSMSGVALGGAKGGMNEYTLDGIPNMTGSNNSFAPPADMVQELRVDVVTYDASIGHAAGGNINMSLKAGANSLHGTAQWDVAPNNLQATDFFTNKRLYDLSTGPVTEQKRKSIVPPRKVHRYSATLGGPLSIPGVYKGENRTFWMYGFQGFNRRNPNNTFLTLPTMAERRGDFSQLLQFGPIYQLYDPATIRPAAGGRFSRQPIPGNIIPSNRLDPMAQRILGLLPEPNVAGTPQGNNNYNITGENSNDFYQNMGRVDHVVNEKHRMFGRVTQSWLHFYRNNYFHNEVRGLDRYRKQRGAAFDDVYVFSPSFILNTKAGFTRFIETDNPQSLGYDLTKLGFPAALVSQLDKQAVAFPQIAIDAFMTMGEGTNYKSTTNYGSFSSAATWMRGNHSLKFGGEFRVLRDHYYNFGNAAPNIAFSTTWTRGPMDNSPAAPIGPGLASFLLGLPTGGGIDNNASRAAQSTYTALFLHDDWKLTRKLTLNVGLRWEYEGPPTERFDRAVAGYDFVTPNPISDAALKAYAASPIPEVPVSQFKTIGSLTFVNRNGVPRNYFSTSKKNFAPRFGFAWQVRPKLVVRGGYGIFFSTVGVDHTSVIQSGFSVRTNLIPSLDNGQTFIATLQNPFPNGVQKPEPVGPKTFLGRSISYWNPYVPTPYMQRWSFAIQRELPWRSLAEIGYVGSRGTHLGVSREVDTIDRRWYSTSPERDQPVIDFMSAAVTNPFSSLPEFVGSGLSGRTVGRNVLLRPYPHFNGMSAQNPTGFTWYHSLQVRAEKRFTHGVSLSGTYTWAKTMDALSYLNDTDPVPEHVISDLDRPQRITISSVWEIPVGRGRPLGSGMSRWLDAVVGGWQYQAIFQYQSGQALGFGNILFRGDVHNIPLPADQRTLERWFNTNAGFEKDPAKQLAWNIRTFPSRLAGLRGPGQSYWDMSLAKVFKVTERWRMQIRTQWEGAMNHPLFSNPNMAPTNPLFGSITSTQGEARRIYLGAKLTF